jgi:hypothetical protein
MDANNSDNQNNALTEYEPTALNDSLMLMWWARLLADGDLEKVFQRDACKASTFFELLQAPRKVVFKTKTDYGVWFAAAMSPAFDGVYFDMWVAKEFRAGKGWLQAMEEALLYAFDRWPILIGVTSQENLLDGHRRLGYTVVGMIPKLWNEQDAWLMYITKESFMARESYLVKRSA